MISTALYIILGGLLAIVLWQMFKGSAKTPAAVTGPEPPRALDQGTAVELESARPGYVISIHGASEDFSDLDFTVDRRSRYETGPRRWIDLSGDYRGRRVYLEFQPGPSPEIMGILDGRKLTLPEVGITEAQLADLDARQDPSQFLTFDGKRWYYESSRELGFFENETGAGEGLYRWLFREADAERYICIEKWEGEPFDVRIARRLHPEDIAVYRSA